MPEALAAVGEDVQGVPVVFDERVHDAALVANPQLVVGEVGVDDVKVVVVPTARQESGVFR